MSRRWTLAVLLLTLILTETLFGISLFRGDLNQDEGWYLYAAGLVAQGKLPYLDDWTAARQTNARLYGELFAECGLERILGLPKEIASSRHVWNQYVIRVPDGRRDALRAHLAQQKIGTEIYYPVPLHRQECFSSLGYGPGSLPHSEQAANETIALPIFPELSPAELRTVVQGIAAFFGVSRHPVTNRPHL